VRVNPAAPHSRGGSSPCSLSVLVRIGVLRPIGIKRFPVQYHRGPLAQRPINFSASILSFRVSHGVAQIVRNSPTCSCSRRYAINDLATCHKHPAEEMAAALFVWVAVDCTLPFQRCSRARRGVLQPEPSNPPAARARSRPRSGHGRSGTAVWLRSKYDRAGLPGTVRPACSVFRRSYFRRVDLVAGEPDREWACRSSPGHNRRPSLSL